MSIEVLNESGEVPAPVPEQELVDLGVARISHGHRPWAAAMNWLAEAARDVFAGEAPPYDAA